MEPSPGPEAAREYMIMPQTGRRRSRSRSRVEDNLREYVKSVQCCRQNPLARPCPLLPTCSCWCVANLIFDAACAQGAACVLLHLDAFDWLLLLLPGQDCRAHSRRAAYDRAKS